MFLCAHRLDNTGKSVRKHTPTIAIAELPSHQKFLSDQRPKLINTLWAPIKAYNSFGLPGHQAVFAWWGCQYCRVFFKIHGRISSLIQSNGITPVCCRTIHWRIASTITMSQVWTLAMLCRPHRGIIPWQGSHPHPCQNRWKTCRPNTSPYFYRELGSIYQFRLPEGNKLLAWRQWRYRRG